MPPNPTCRASALLAAAFVAAGARPLVGVAQEPGALAPGTAESRGLLPDATHVWTLALEADEYAVVEIRQKGADVAVEVVGPDGTLRAVPDLPTGAAGTERAVVLSDEPAVWKLRIAAREDWSLAGSYEVEWTERRPAEPSDAVELEVDALVRSAAAEHRAWNEAAAAELYDQAARIATAGLGGAHPATARALYLRALLAFEWGRYDLAGPGLEEAVRAFEAALPPGHPERAMGLTTLASYYADLGRYSDAEPLFEGVVELLRSALPPDDLDLAAALANLAAFHQYQARLQDAETLYREALTIQESALSPRHPAVARTHGNLGLLYASQGRQREAGASLERALEITAEAHGPDGPEVAYLLADLVWLHADAGRFAEAEMTARRALDVLTAHYGTPHPDVARAALDLAAVLHLQGRAAEAEPLYRSAVESWEASDADPVDLAYALDNLGLLLQESGRAEEAEGHHLRALELMEASDPSHPDIAMVLSHLALMYTEQGRLAEADPLHVRALAVVEASLGPDHPDAALALNNLAAHRHRQERLAEADSLATRAIDILERVPVYPEERINAYALRARVRRDAGDRDGAMDDLDEALYTAEDLRPQVSGGEEARARFFGRWADHFDRMVDWLLEEGDAEEAFEIAERGRARVLLDQLAAARIDLRRSIPEDVRDEVERNEAAAGARLAELQQRLTLSWSRPDLGPDERRSRVLALEDSVRGAAAEYETAYDRVRSASPLWRDMITSGGEPVDLRDVQRALVPDAGVLLMYQLGRETSWLFVIPPGRGQLVAHPLRVDEALARETGLPAGPLTRDGLALALGTVEGGDVTGLLAALRRPGNQRGTRVAGRRGSTLTLSSLRALLLPDSVWAGAVASAEEVVVVPDGPLHALPFEALELRRVEGNGEPVYWLDEGPVLRYAPSATALHNIVERPYARAFPVGGSPRLLSVSNPVYDPLGVASTDTTAVPEGRVSEGLLTRGGALAPLPGTGRESRAIWDALDAVDAAGAMEVLSGVEATEPRVRSAVEDKRYLHLATHGIVDQRRGSLFASLALTPPGTADAELEHDGFLQLHEIYDLDLTDTELAVLSACETNLGSSVHGEGVFALSRGFLVAGVRRVVATQWQVNDDSTARLVSLFFDRLVRAETAGEPVDYARALRDAKRELRSTEAWADPYHWAPFVITGGR